MYAYELHQHRSAELIRRARQDRLVREALRARRQARKNAEPESHTRRLSGRHRFARAA
ncbi:MULTISPECIES: hypothetical protein [unclassified Streptomyces]|uniref:hypothetical protein n=1 Tax=unclassified Streptomyces TaxID=2593676 RepID=UPI003D7602FE